MQAPIAQIMKYLIYFVLLIFLLSLVGLFVNYNQAVSYREYTVDQIKRGGGLTPEVQTRLQNYSKENYSGRFKVVSESGNGKKKFGETVDFYIEGQTVGDLYIASSLIRLKGSSTSWVR